MRHTRIWSLSNYKNTLTFAKVGLGNQSPTAPESNHAVAAAIDEALEAKQEGRGRVILFNLSGHGHFDMQAYTDYFAGKLTDQSYDERELAMAPAGLPSVDMYAEFSRTFPLRLRTSLAEPKRRR